MIKQKEQTTGKKLNQLLIIFKKVKKIGTDSIKNLSL